MSEAVKEKALQYYPKAWNKNRIIALVKAGKLTEAEYKEITGEEYDSTSDMQLGVIGDIISSTAG